MLVVNVANVVFPYTIAQTIMIEIFAQNSIIHITNVTLAFVSTFLMFRFRISSDKEFAAKLLGDGLTWLQEKT